MISHPFRVLPTGQVATVDEDSDDAATEMLAVLMLTRPGERPLAPTFGLTDPVFGGVDPAELAAAVQAFGPDVRIDAVTTVAVSDAEQHVTVEFSV